MRQIKFRGKRIDDGEWIYGYLADVQEQYLYATINYVFNDGEEYWESCDHVYVNTVGQFTGLTDKNGTKIFEGDIIQTEFSKSIVKFGEYQHINAQSGYRNGDIGFYAYHIDETQRGCVRNDLLYFNEQCEVIGNIHEK